MRSEYLDLLARKAVAAPLRGLASSPDLAPHLFPFQRECVDFGLRAGSAGVFLDTGLGKTFVELEWCRHAATASNGMALILTPLAVARQIEREARRFGYDDVRVIREQSDAKPGTNICNYDRLEKLDPAAFGAVALDESSVLKNFTGKTTRALISMFEGHRWKLSASATPAPNDHMELGQQCEFLSVMASNEMLARWFISDQTQMGRYRLRGHAVESFWDWMASWARMAEHPRDLGDDVDGFDLPPLRVTRHEAEAATVETWGDLFDAVSVSATTLHDVKRRTASSRAATVVDVIRRSTGSGAKLAACGRPNTPIVAASSTTQTRPSESDASLSRELAMPTRNTCASTTSPIGSDGPNIEKRTRRSETRGKESGTPLIQHSGIALGSEPRSGASATATSAGSICEGNSGSPQSSTTPCSPAKEGLAPFASLSSETPGGSDSTLTIATEAALYVGCSARRATSDSGNSETTPLCSEEPWLIWVDTDYEQDAVETEIAEEFGPRSFFSTRGSHPADRKESDVFRWIEGERPILIGKPSQLGYGLNFQHCARMVFMGRSFSYESYYQAVRRCWRFGQKRPVEVHLIVADSEDHIGDVIDRKAADHAQMKAAMVGAMRRATSRSSSVKAPYIPTHEGSLPTWL